LTAAIRRTVTFPGISMERLKGMLGAYNGHLKQIEQRLEVKISHRGDAFYIDGEIDAVERAESLLMRLHEETDGCKPAKAGLIHAVPIKSVMYSVFCKATSHSGLVLPVPVKPILPWLLR